MAVQQNKKSRSRKGMRRSHDHVARPNFIFCSCGATTRPYTVCPKCGRYKGKVMVKIVVKEKKKQDSSEQ
ncbi:MAG: 50S ribosomal protein L32 [Desulfovibrio sp.]|nr:50S ribosomal protein L32 [Desulfovibrio sp.]